MAAFVLVSAAATAGAQPVAPLPQPLEPAEGAVLPNGWHEPGNESGRKGITPHRRPVVWDFEWTPVPGAEQYELKAIPPKNSNRSPEGCRTSRPWCRIIDKYVVPDGVTGRPVEVT